MSGLPPLEQQHDALESRQQCGQNTPLSTAKVWTVSQSCLLLTWFGWSMTLHPRRAVLTQFQPGSIKQLIQLLAPFLTTLFNKSLALGYLPEAFRLAEITPILKKSSLDPAVLGNYRPISNLPFISKVLERAVNERMLVHLQTNGLMPKHQSAYRRGHSTETALLKVTSDALLAADQGKLTLLGMLDLSAAFDCVDHDILLNRLEKSFGFCGMAIGWIRSYLTGRKQYVRYSGSMSTVTPMLFGVPQGSVLGPLLFVLYTADVFRIAEELDFSIHGYADDLQIYDHCLVRDTVQLNGRLVYCIDCMGQWMLKNRLKLNASKTEFIWLGSPRRLAACTFDSIVVDGSAIQPSLTVRDLGVIIDPAISLIDHVNRLTRTCYFHIRQLRSIRRSLTIDACHALVRAMVISRLDYCNGLLGGAPKYLLGQLSGVMRAAARLILVLPRRSHMTDAISTRLHWLDIPARVVFKLCVIAFRCQHGSAPLYLADYFIPVGAVEGRSSLRSAATGQLLVPRTKTVTVGPRAFAVCSPTAWNNLPVDLCDPIDNLSLSCFRKKLKTYLFKLSSSL